MYNTVFIEKYLHIRGHAQFKLVLFKGHIHKERNKNRKSDFYLVLYSLKRKKH